MHGLQQRPNSASSVSNASVGPVRVPVGDSDGGVVMSTAAASDDDVDDDRLIYRHHGGGGMLVTSSTARPSCGWMPPLLRQSSDTLTPSYRAGPRLHSAPCYTSAAAAAMFASRSGSGYHGSLYGSAAELGGYGTSGWSVSATRETYCNGAGGGSEACVQFSGARSMSYGPTAVPLFVASPYDHDNHQDYQRHQPHKLQLEDNDMDDTAGEYEAESSRRVHDDKDWIKYQPL